jgi:hypothetical protein
MKYLQTMMKRPHPAGGTMEVPLIINPDYLQYAYYVPLVTVRDHDNDRDIPIGNYLELIFIDGQKIKLEGEPADTVWGELQRQVPEWMRRS